MTLFSLAYLTIKSTHVHAHARTKCHVNKHQQAEVHQNRLILVCATARNRVHAAMLKSV